MFAAAMPPTSRLTAFDGYRVLRSLKAIGFTVLDLRSCTWVLLGSLITMSSACATSTCVVIDTGGALWDMNLSTAELSNTRETGLQSIRGIEFDSAGRLFGLAESENSFGFFAIDTATGATTRLLDLDSLSPRPIGLAWDPATASFWIAQNGYPNGFVSKLDVTTGELSQTTALRRAVPSSVSSTISMLTLKPNGNLYAVDSFLERLYEADTTNRTGTELGRVMGDFGGYGAPAAMDFDYASNTIYTVDRVKTFGGVEVDRLGVLDTDAVEGAVLVSTELERPLAGIAIAYEGLPGDYNDDGSVDLADYTVWRDHLGSPAGTLPNDIAVGDIGVAQYLAWKSNYGIVAQVDETSSAVTNVPEPAAATLLLCAGILWGPLSAARSMWG